MSKSLLEQLPEIVRAGKRQAERIMEGLEARSRVGLQTRELVTPAKDTNWQEFQSLKPNAKAQTTLGGDLALLNDTAGQTQLVANRREWFNRLIYGDNLLAMSALLAGDDVTPSLRGKVDLIYIDPPFDSKADYRTKITLAGGDVEQKPTVIFMRLRYVRENGLPGFYFPDFLVRTKTGIWLTETKAQDQLIQADVIRKKIAAVAWCERLNELPPEQRSGRTWNYCLLGEHLFYEFKDKGATMEDILQFARVRAKAAGKESLFE